MKHHSDTIQADVYERLKWLTFFRLVFSSLLLGSTVILQIDKESSLFAHPFLAVYGLASFIFSLSAIYAWLLKHARKYVALAYVQIALDTLIVTLIIYITGGYSSIFSFLYLLVVIYSSILLSRRGSLAMAILCALQYGVMVAFEYLGALQPMIVENAALAMNYDGKQVAYKIIMILFACVAVSLLSSFLSEQTKKTTHELRTMETHVKRVEKMAAVGEMAAGLAHEIKNPLASLSGSIQLLQEEMHENSEQRKLMQIVLREADRLSLLVSNFLLFARPPSGAPVPIELERALADTITLFEKDAKCSQTIKIKSKLVPGIWVEMDPMHFQQVLWNLLLNAAEAIEGEGVITIKMDPEPKVHTRVWISDTGGGIPRNQLKSIFDPFFTTKPHGTGLGLPIVHSILDSYGYRLDVESEVDAGTTVTLYLKRFEVA